jgi:hypothetical protein
MWPGRSPGGSTLCKNFWKSYLTQPRFGTKGAADMHERGRANMKRTSVHYPLVGTVLSIGICAALAAPLEVSVARKALRDAPVAELPAKAAALLSQASGEDLIPSAVNILSAAHAVRPAATVAVVGALARQAPDAAPALAVRAVTLSKKPGAEFVDQVAAAAAAGAPQQAAAIVEALCKVAPQHYAVVATAVAAVVPQSRDQVLAAVTRALPGLQPFVEQARSRLGTEASLAAVLHEANVMLTATANAAKTKPEILLAGGNSGGLGAPVPPPTYGPPFTPLPPGEVTEITRSTTRVAKPGQGRDYSTP